MVSPNGFKEAITVAFSNETSEEKEARYSRNARELGVDTFGNIEYEEDGRNISVPLTGHVIKKLIEDTIKAK